LLILYLIRFYLLHSYICTHITWLFKSKVIITYTFFYSIFVREKKEAEVAAMKFFSGHSVPAQFFPYFEPFYTFSCLGPLLPSLITQPRWQVRSLRWLLSRKLGKPFSMGMLLGDVIKERSVWVAIFWARLVWKSGNIVSKVCWVQRVLRIIYAEGGKPLWSALRFEAKQLEFYFAQRRRNHMHAIVQNH
jgi:hypothetical protein